MSKEQKAEWDAFFEELSKGQISVDPKMESDVSLKDKWRRIPIPSGVKDQMVSDDVTISTHEKGCFYVVLNDDSGRYEKIKAKNGIQSRKIVDAIVNHLKAKDGTTLKWELFMENELRKIFKAFVK